MHNDRMRKTDADERTHFRSEDRIFQANGGWCFATREGDQGPHESRQVAEKLLDRFIVGVRGDVDLNEVSFLDKSDSKDASIWDDRPDVHR
ncbi:MAG: DUF6316 family protein [Pseudomonadales bacterium]